MQKGDSTAVREENTTSAFQQWMGKTTPNLKASGTPPAHPKPLDNIWWHRHLYPIPLPRPQSRVLLHLWSATQLQVTVT